MLHLVSVTLMALAVMQVVLVLTGLHRLALCIYSKTAH
jgi:hypothetical protein